MGKLENKYEHQTVTSRPDSVLVATLLNKTTGALQTHIRLNSATLKSYTQLRDLITNYHQSRHIMSQTATDGPDGTPMDLGAITGRYRNWSWKGKGKGTKGTYYNSTWNPAAMYSKGTGKGKGKYYGGYSNYKGKGKGKRYFNYKGKGYSKGKSYSKGKGKTKTGKGQSTCHNSGQPGHFARDCTKMVVGNVTEDSDRWSYDDPNWTFDDSTADWDDGTPWIGLDDQYYDQDSFVNAIDWCTDDWGWYEDYYDDYGAHGHSGTDWHDPTQQSPSSSQTCN